MRKIITSAAAAALVLATFGLAGAQMQGGNQGSDQRDNQSFQGSTNQNRNDMGTAPPQDQYGQNQQTDRQGQTSAQDQSGQMGQQSQMSGQGQSGQINQGRQEQSGQKQQRAKSQDDQDMQRAASMYLDGQKLIGSDVKDKSGKNIAKVSDLILDRNGKVVYVIVSHGGVAGFGGKDISIPVGAVTLSGSGKDRYFTLNLSAEELNSAPQYNRLADLVNPRYVDTTYRFFGLQPQWGDQGAMGGGQIQPEQQQLQQRSDWRIQEGSTQQQNQGQNQQQNNR
ncbi:MAG TPA: PRC-barrel domain-containing protein [Thermodesulfobacteriota bacterium]|nr:PRC-barrel domain-containing protein [Thermodesulfobacteriota bacterium]